MTSQHLANFYLSHLDHFVMQNLRPCSYVRYMDDFVLWFKDKEGMQSAQWQIREYLKNVLKLNLKEQATMAVPSRQGLHFLGFQIMPYSIKLSNQSRLRLKRHICHWNWEYQQGGCEFTLARKADSVLGWSHLAHAHSLLSSML